MKLSILKIRVGELKAYVNSQRFKSLETVPITKERADSYSNNPHAKAEDVALYLGYINDQLVAFRSLFAGQVWSDRQWIRFGWCSGAWVHPEYRRRGYSQLLLIEALKDWDNRLMLTNYSPETEQLYLNTGRFKAIHLYKGMRGYLIPRTRKLFQRKSRNMLSQLILFLADQLICTAASSRLLFYQPKNKTSLRFVIQEYPDEACYNLDAFAMKKSLFRRDKKELQWIFQHPWITSDPLNANDRYPFSSYLPSFNYYTVKIFQNNSLSGFFTFSVREKQLKTLCFYLSREDDKEIAEFLRNYCATNKIEILTVYHEKIAAHLKRKTFPFLYIKSYGQKIYSSFEIEVPDGFGIQDGDGDTIFT